MSPGPCPEGVGGFAFVPVAVEFDEVDAKVSIFAAGATAVVGESHLDVR